MDKLIEKYRVFYPYDCEGNALKSEIDKNNNRRYNKNDAILYCYNGKAYITKMDRSTLRIIVFGVGIFNNILEGLNKNNIKIKDNYLLDGEGFIDFNYKDMDLVAPIVKAKRNRKTPRGMIDKDNYKYHLRIMKNIHPKYKEELHRIIESERKDE